MIQSLFLYINTRCFRLVCHKLKKKFFFEEKLLPLSHNNNT